MKQGQDNLQICEIKFYNGAEKTISAKQEAVRKEGGQKVTGKILRMDGKSKGNIFLPFIFDNNNNKVSGFLLCQY